MQFLIASGVHAAISRLEVFSDGASKRNSLLASAHAFVSQTHLMNTPMFVFEKECQNIIVVVNGNHKQARAYDFANIAVFRCINVTLFSVSFRLCQMV